MSQARLYFTKKSRKEWTCSSCRQVIPVGSPVVSFAVGFRGYEQKRCSKPECQPTRAQRESSLVSEVYAAIDGADVDGATSLEDLEAIRDEIAETCSNVADEYESNPMYEVNYDLQERAQMIRSAGENLEGWSPDEDEPEGGECSDCNGTGEIEDAAGENPEECDTCNGTGEVEADEDELSDWLETAKASLQQAIDDMELP